jgi:hypothetical protein
MKLDKSHPMNRLVLEYFRHREGHPAKPLPIAAPDQHADPYWEAGSHPDIVERVWDVLAASLPADCRAVVYGTPALVHPRAGVVIALAYGTQYAIRVPDEFVDDALKAGCAIERHWTNGGRTNIEEELGRGWVFGCWGEEEKLWLAKMYADLAVIA